MKRQLYKKQIMLYLVFLIIIAFIGCSKKDEKLESDNTQVVQKSSHEVCIDVLSYENLLFNMYDMVIYIDEEEVGTVANGKRLIKYIDLSEGSHTLKACKYGKEKVCHNITFDITKDTTVTCELKHKKNSIKCLKATTSSGIDNKEIEIEDYTNVLLSEAIDRLNSIGIYDIQQKPNSEIYSEDDWIVVWQSINPGSKVRKGSSICLDCVDRDYYINLNAQGYNLDEVYSRFENSGLEVNYCDENRQDNTKTIEALTDEQRSEWIVLGLDYLSGKRVTFKTVNFDEKRKEIAEEKARIEAEKIEEERKLAEAEKEKQLEAEKEKQLEEEKKKEEERKKEEEKKKEEERKQTETEKAKEDKNKKESQSDKTSEEINKTSEEKKSEEVVPENPYTYIPRYTISWRTDYGHLSDECITLGNNEKAIVTISAKVADATADDFLIYCEDSSVKYSIINVKNDDIYKTTDISISVQASSAGYYDLEIYTCYELYELEDEDDEVEYTRISIHKLDSKDGKVVYYTPTGEKYHLSQSCAGANAMETTLYDAEGYYDPCSKCAY